MHMQFRFPLIWSLVFIWSAISSATVLVGEHESNWSYPLHTYYMDSRTQTIYHPTDLGTDGYLNGIDLYVTTRPGQDLTHLYLRIKHTTADTIGTTSFDNTDLVTVLDLENVDVSTWSAPGWVHFSFNTSFSYNGSDNLLVDWVIDNSTYTTNGSSSAWEAGNCRSLYKAADISTGDLLNTSLTGTYSSNAPQIRLTGSICKPVSGTWTISESPVIVTNDLKVNAGASLVITPGVEVKFEDVYGLNVEGRLQALGTSAAPISFTPVVDDSSWNRLSFNPNESSDSSVVSYARIRGTESSAISFSHAYRVRIDHTSIEDCRSTGSGSALSFYYSSPLLQQLDISTDVNSSSLLGITYSSYPRFDQCVFTANHSIAEFNWSGSATFNECTVYATDTESMFDLNYGAQVTLNNCIVWGGSVGLPFYFSNYGPTSGATFNYSTVTCLDSLISNPTYGWVAVQEGCSGSDPLFVDQYNGDFHLTEFSPCVDSASPLLPQDPDGSPADRGAGRLFYNHAIPIIQQVTDLPDDQGHQIYVEWTASSVDLNDYAFGTFYSIWREDPIGRTDGLVFDSPATALENDPDDGTPITWRDRDNTWIYLGQVPAMQRPTYGFVASTIHDSTATDPGLSTFQVVYHGLTTYEGSSSASGYSVDNIPPDAVRQLRFAESRSRSNLVLEWDPVTTGTLNGSQYEELNGIWYRVFGGSTPYFSCDEEHYLGTVTEPAWEVVNPVETFFFRVIASDQE